jgi:hypothetical protein
MFCEYPYTGFAASSTELQLKSLHCVSCHFAHARSCCCVLWAGANAASAGGSSSSSSSIAFAGIKRQTGDRSATATPVQLPGFTASSSGGIDSTDTAAAMSGSSTKAARLTHSRAEIEPRFTRGSVSKRRRVNTPSGRH